MEPKLETGKSCPAAVSLARAESGTSVEMGALRPASALQEKARKKHNLVT